MGTWDIGSFDNDTALDWAADLSRSQGDELLLTSLDLRDFDEIDSPDAVIAIAAAEVVAALPIGSRAIATPLRMACARLPLTPSTEQ